MFNFFKKPRRDKAKTKINLHPDWAAPVQYTRGFSVSLHKNRNRPGALGFISDVMGTGEPGVLMHSSESGNIGFYNALEGIPAGQATIMKNPYEVHRQLLEKFSIDLKTVGGNTPLHLIICFGNAKTSMSQQLANFLNRTVISYGASAGEGCTVFTGGAQRVLGKKGRILVKSAGVYVPASKRSYIPVIHQPRYLKIPMDYVDYIA